MKRFLVRLLPYLLLFLAFSVVRYEFQAGKYSDTRSHLYEDDRRDFDGWTLIFGDSKSQYGFDDSILSSKVGENYQNLSIWAGRPKDYLENAERLSIRNSLVFITLSTRNMSGIDSTNAAMRTFQIDQLFNFNLYKKIVNRQVRNSYVKEHNGSLQFTDQKKRNSPYDWKIDSSQQAANLQSDDLDFCVASKLRHLYLLIGHLRDRNNRVILIDLPERKPYEIWSKGFESRLHAEIERSTGLSVHDFGAYPDSLFYDSHHLNTRGASVFSHAFLDTFKQELGPGKVN